MVLPLILYGMNLPFTLPWRVSSATITHSTYDEVDIFIADIPDLRRAGNRCGGA